MTEPQSVEVPASSLSVPLVDLTPPGDCRCDHCRWWMSERSYEMEQRNRVERDLNLVRGILSEALTGKRS